jgi:SIR2-like domain
VALKSKTLFVLGAGASKEIGLPTGYELKHNLASRLDIRFKDGFAQTSGDFAITDVLRHVVQSQNSQNRNINPYLHKAWQMVSALPQAISIDNYIDALEDPDIELLGKIAIAREIIESEKNSLVYFKNRDDMPEMIKRVKDTNYHGIFQLLSEGFRKSNFESMFENVAFISFNYDRSVEWYLHNAVLNFFGIDEREAASAVSKIRIIHPYGTLGELPLVQPQSASIPYGGNYRDNIAQIANGLRTFTEQIADDKITSAIEAEVTSAHHIVFLGFGFHDINMRTLATQKKTVLRHVFGTALGVSKSDIEAIGDTIVQCFASGSENQAFQQVRRIDLRSDLKCASVFAEYARSLRS